MKRYTVLFAAMLIASFVSTSAFANCPVNVRLGEKYCKNDGYWWVCERCSSEPCEIMKDTSFRCIPERSNLSGNWRGYATFASSRFNYEWTIQQDGPRISGSITISRTDGSERATYQFGGSLQSDALSFGGTRWLTGNSGHWCIAAGELRVLGQQNRLELRGHWGPHNVPGGCPAGGGGEIYLSKI